MLPSRLLLVFCLSLIAATSARGQAMPVQTPSAATAQTQGLSRSQLAAQERQDAELIAAARKVRALVDAGELAEVWAGASPAARRLVPDVEFTAQVAADRARLGAVVSRGQPSVDRETYPAGGRVPHGEYINVATATRFARASQLVRELVSFRLDEDQVWRVSGYSVRP